MFDHMDKGCDEHTHIESTVEDIDEDEIAAEIHGLEAELPDLRGCRKKNRRTEASKASETRGVATSDSR